MKKTIYFVTTNKVKIANAERALKPFGIKVKPVNIEMPESRAEKPRLIAIEKAKYAYKKLKKPVMVRVMRTICLISEKKNIDINNRISVLVADKIERKEKSTDIA